MAERLVFESCYAEWNGEKLTVGNALVERVWRVSDGQFFAASLMDKVAGVEWLSGVCASASWTPAVCVDGLVTAVHLINRDDEAVPVEAESLRVVFCVERASGSLRYQIQVFPNSASVTVQLVLDGVSVDVGDTAAQQATGAEPTGVELLDAARRNAGPSPDDLQDVFQLAPQHMRVIQVRLMGRTDVHNELVFENEWLLATNENNLRLQGNLFVVEDTLTGHGLLVLKQGPLPHARPVGCAFDVLIQGRDRGFRFYGHGMGQGVGEGYPATVIAYQNGKVGRQEALQHFQRQIRRLDVQRDGRFLSNTWGDRSQDSRIQEGFMVKEVAAGARLGVDVIQIDDGWEKGTTSNSVNAKTAGGVWEGFWASDAEFWHPHPTRFPTGLAGVIATAREKGMQFGLWFGPDSIDDFKNWEKDAETILDFHHRLGVNYIKIDGVKARTKISEVNLRRFFDRVLEGSNGKVTFDLDVTAEIRPGYFGMMHVGPLFVENRYTDFHRYWPHQTLRNVWQLSHYVDPLRLRMEFLNHDRNQEKYPNDPLSPKAYRSDYLFATVMMANPLGWFEVSNLSDDYIATASKLVAVWKKHRGAMASGFIHPIGETPDGTAWTGFASVGADRRAGYVLLFREYNDQVSCRMDLAMFDRAAFSVEVLAGVGSATLRDGVLAAQIPEAQQFLFVRVQAE